jgi:hypothetical protein
MSIGKTSLRSTYAPNRWGPNGKKCPFPKYWAFDSNRQELLIDKMSAFRQPLEGTHITLPGSDDKKRGIQFFGRPDAIYK